MTADDMTADELRAHLEAACEDLWWSSESDYPVRPVWQPFDAHDADLDSPIEASVVRQRFDCPADAAVQIAEVEGFFERATTPKSWHTEEDKVQCDRLQQLKTFLTDTLTHLQVYRCGEVEISVFVLGYTPDGDIAGVKTILVET